MEISPSVIIGLGKKLYFSRLDCINFVYYILSGRESIINMTEKENEPQKIYGKIKRKYSQKSIKQRIEALFLDNIGKIITREQILTEIYIN